jgi:hypothetical protein
LEDGEGDQAEHPSGEIVSVDNTGEGATQSNLERVGCRKEGEAYAKERRGGKKGGKEKTASSGSSTCELC